MTHQRPSSREKVISHHISALDGLRAFAIIAVIFHHCGEYFLLQNSPPGSLLQSFVENLGSGVDLFFAMSGFLITGILLDTLDRPYYFQRFYWRRGLRIWPLYYAFLFAVFLFHRRTFSGIGLTPFLLYYRNFLGPDRASDIYVGQFWSLCVEEQFYLVWPLVIYFTSRRLRLPLIAFLMTAALLCRVVLMAIGTGFYVAYRLPFCHMDVLLAGAAIAVLMRNGISNDALKKISLFFSMLGLFGWVFIIGTAYPKLRFWIFPLSLTCTSLFFGGIVGICARASGKLSSAILGGTFLRAISTRSYAMYVFHLVPLYASYKLSNRLGLLPLPEHTALALIFFIGLVTYGLAWLSWRFFENPILRLKNWEWFADRTMLSSAGETQGPIRGILSTVYARSEPNSIEDADRTRPTD